MAESSNVDKILKIIRVGSIIAILAILLFVACIFTCQKEEIWYFCGYCGAKKYEEKSFLIMRHETIEKGDNEYTKFYYSLFPESCIHSWMQTGEHSSNILFEGGSWGCTAGWEQLYERGLFPQLEQLNDKNKIHNILVILNKIDWDKRKKILYDMERKNRGAIFDSKDATFLKDNYGEWIKEHNGQR